MTSNAFVDSGEANPFSLEQPGLFACYQAAASGIAVSPERAGQPVLHLLVHSRIEPSGPRHEQRADEPVAEALGVNVHAKQLVDGRDRKQLEQLCRYVMRPPLSQERLEWRPDKSLELTLKNVWKDGTRALVLEPFDLLVRLCSAIPPPWFTSAYGASARRGSPNVGLRGKLQRAGPCPLRLNIIRYFGCSPVTRAIAFASCRSASTRRASHRLPQAATSSS